MSNKPVVGITIGDVNGIGVEIILKSFSDNNLFKYCTPLVFGNIDIINNLNKGFIDINKLVSINEFNRMENDRLNVFELDYEIEEGNGPLAVKSIEKASQFYKEGKIDFIVTSPINKEIVKGNDFNFVGHTEYYNDKFEGNAMMIMVSHIMKVALVTEHVSLSSVALQITEGILLKKLQVLTECLKEDFGINQPQIAVLGLNPHSGDNGIIGQEDKEIIIPAINKFNASRMSVVSGPFSADSFFVDPEKLKNYDAILAMYHDQGLIPFKTLSFGKGVNYTSGLDVIRTSPDHGVGYDISGKGIANENSFKEAIALGLRIYRNRNNLS